MGDLDKAQLLARINADLPRNVDWKAGARSYFSELCRTRPMAIPNQYLKPFSDLKSGERAARQTFIELMENFVNVFALLDLPAGARVLDVACGSGWLCDFYSRLGFEVHGVDISAELLEHARKRVPAAHFVLHDIEETALPAEWSIDAAIFESSLHHLYDPVAALAHVRAALAADGLVVVIEGENRSGGILPAYRAEMDRYHTIERPYSREELCSVLRAAGLPSFAFFGKVNGWFPLSSAAVLPSALESAERARNYAVAAVSERALRRVVPLRSSGGDAYDLLEGFSPGTSSGTFWSAPFSRFRVLRSGPFAVTVGVTSPSQCVRAFTERTRFELRPEGQCVLDLGVLQAGTEVMLCSDHVFVPAWDGASDDPRPLSFWVSFPADASPA